MKRSLLLMAVGCFLGAYSFGQEAIQGLNNNFSLQQNPVQISHGGSEPTIDTDNNNPNHNGGGHLNDANSERSRLNGGGHVTVQDILGFDKDNLESVNRNNGISQTTGTTGNPVSVVGGGTTPSSSQNQMQNANSSQVTISIFPNPTSDQLNVITEGEIIFGTVEVIDLTGKMIKTQSNVFSHSNGSNVTLSVHELKSGMYFIRFKTDKNIYVKRFQVR